MTGDMHFDTTTEAVEEAESMRQAQDDLAVNEQQKREQVIAEVYEKIGQIRTAAMVSKFTQVSSLMWLKQMKESKAYKDLSEIGNWENFCRSIGLSRSQVDKDLLNLNVLGEDFMLTVSSLNVGYRDLRKLRQLKSDGELLIENKTVKLGDEEIPLDADHTEDLQAAIENLLEAKNSELADKTAIIKAKDKTAAAYQKTIENQEKTLQSYEKDLEGRGIQPDEANFLRQMDKLKLDMDAIDGKLDPENIELTEPMQNTRMRAAYLEAVGYIRRIADALDDTAKDLYGNPAQDGGWIQPDMREIQS